ncbi:RraA family protein [Paenisporosarcina antarctica]|uniref:Putative 4-hydroxy-4-methyl-2-oxoglutarate aldolase n=1 Tax=Paenisporosarcina antarctica TaxID=417367 RepID=A0A4P7A1M4_9BACL|nr:RraA family protein [Paenisporosarcina antarctica]QBP42717.1 RraA family protein [Paenisporosarcina antarctica]
MNQLPILLSEELIKRAENLTSTLLSDAMGCTGSMDYKIKPVVSKARIVGTALTVSMRPGDNLFLHQAIHSGSKGYVLIADGKDHKENAYLGELMAAAAKVVGLEGIVIDGLVRDKVNLEELGFPIFAKGFIPNGPLKDGPGLLNSIISCGGVVVCPGDLIIGDEDGVVVVPKDRISEVLEKAEKKLEYEEKRLKTILEYEENKGTSIEPPWLSEKMKAF